MQTLQAEVPGYEVYSIDEGFCDFKGIPANDIKPLALHLSQLIWQQQRIPMGVSVAKTKTLAKLGQYAAKTYAKLGGICVIENEQQRLWVLRHTPLSEVWGIGRQLAKKLSAMGLQTAYDLSLMGRDDAQKLFGVCLVRTVYELNNQPCIPLEEQPDPRQNIVCTRSFGQRLTELHDIRTALVNYVARACQKLRKQGLYANRISVFIHTSTHDAEPYYNESHCSIPGGSNDTCRCSQFALKLLEPLFVPGYRYAKAGVGFIDLRPDTNWQLDAFCDYDRNKHSLMKVIDQINAKFEPGTIRTARQGRKALFSMKRDLLSPSYLTNWGDIPKAKT